MIDFKKYDRDNPQIWRAFERFTFEAKNKGFEHYSAKGIFELIRWHTSTTGGGLFKLNNSFHADYARKMMEVHPAFKGFFRLRELKAKRT